MSGAAVDSFPRGKTAIVSAATFGMGEAPGFSTKDLAAHASIAALRQAHLQPGDVDALFVCLSDDMLSGMSVAEYLGIRPKLTDNNRTGGSSFLIHVMLAALALESRQCDVALIAYGSNQRTATGKLAKKVLRETHGAAGPVAEPAAPAPDEPQVGH